MEIRKFSNRLMELVEEGTLSSVEVVRMCVKYMSEDDVKDMCDCNELTDLMFSDPEEEDEEWEDDELDEDDFPNGLGFGEEDDIDSWVFDDKEEE